ncbi:hypothetical protein FWP33_07350 [Vibrio parahaemolyticus]|nr:hypothetical protein [Vibrio parahaemolyticus]
MNDDSKPSPKTQNKIGLIIGVTAVLSAGVYTFVSSTTPNTVSSGAPITESPLNEMPTKVSFVFNEEQYNTFSDVSVYAFTANELNELQTFLAAYQVTINPIEALKYADSKSASSHSDVVTKSLSNFSLAYSNAYEKAKPEIESTMTQRSRKFSELQSKRGDLIEKQYEHLGYTGLIQDKLSMAQTEEMVDPMLISQLTQELEAAEITANGKVGDIKEINTSLQNIESELNILASDLDLYNKDPESFVESKAILGSINEFRALNEIGRKEFLESFSEWLGEPVASQLKKSMKLEEAVEVLVTYKDSNGTYHFIKVPVSNDTRTVIDWKQSKEIDDMKFLGIRAFSNS